MNKKTLAKLEYNKIIELLTDHASSFSGKELCRRLKPMTSLLLTFKLLRKKPARLSQGLLKKVALLLAAVIR